MARCRTAASARPQTPPAQPEQERHGGPLTDAPGAIWQVRAVAIRYDERGCTAPAEGRAVRAELMAEVPYWAIRWPSQSIGGDEGTRHVALRALRSALEALYVRRL